MIASLVRDLSIRCDYERKDAYAYTLQPERKAAYKKANQLLNDEQPYNFGFAQNRLLGVSKKVQNITPGPFARQGQAKPETWWIQ